MFGSQCSAIVMEVPLWGNIMWWIILMWMPLLFHWIVTQWRSIAWGKPASGNTNIPGKNRRVMSPFKTRTYLRYMKDVSHFPAQPKWWMVLVHTCMNYEKIHHSKGLVQERRNSSALAMEIRLSYTNPSMYTQCFFFLCCLSFHTAPLLNNILGYEVMIERSNTFHGYQSRKFIPRVWSVTTHPMGAIS